jgi:hypothetical protein
MPEDKLEKIIRECAGEIFGQDAGLPGGHRERFERRLREYKERSKASLPADNFIPAVSDGSLGTVVYTRQSSAHTASLKHADSAVDCRHATRAVSLGKRRIAIVATAAAVLACIVFLSNPSEEDLHGTELANVRNYYNMQLEKQFEKTRQLAFNVDNAHREALLAGIERIEYDPIPDVRLSGDENIALIVNVYKNKIETLRNIQYIIREQI